MFKAFLVEGPMVFRLVILTTLAVLVTMFVVKLIHLAREDFPGKAKDGEKHG